MIHWHVTYVLACGHSSGHVMTTDKGKRDRGDLWPCAICGVEVEIQSVSAVTA